MAEVEEAVVEEAPVEEAAETIAISSDLRVRKLLRGPRYFDVETEDQAQTCYNCGKEGHIAKDCKKPRPPRNCFVCAEPGHTSRECPTTRFCFRCRKTGHFPASCPSLGGGGGGQGAAVEETQRCLVCGRTGHGEEACSRGYSEEDLKRVRCCVCYEFGHVICGTSREEEDSGGAVSCYQCGEEGHSGEVCAQTRQSYDVGPSYGGGAQMGGGGGFGGGGRMGGGGGWGAPRGPSGRGCFVCGGEGHFARDCVQGRQADIYGRGRWEDSRWNSWDSPDAYHTPSRGYREHDDRRGSDRKHSRHGSSKKSEKRKAEKHTSRDSSKKKSRKK